MSVSDKGNIKQQTAEELARISQISMDVRQAARNVLPAPPKQYFTMMVPCEVLNLDVISTLLSHTPSLGWVLIWDRPFNRTSPRILMQRGSRRLLPSLTLSNSLRQFRAIECLL